MTNFPKTRLQVDILVADTSKKAIAKAVIKSLVTLRHPSLKTHKYDDFVGPNGEEVFESYAQNNTHLVHIAFSGIRVPEKAKLPFWLSLLIHSIL